MGKTWIAARAAGGSITPNSATRFLSIGGTLDVETSANNNSNTIWRGAGTATDLAVYISANTRATATTVRFDINGSAAGPTLTIGAGVTGWVFWPSPSTDSQAFADGDVVRLRVATSTGGGGITIAGISFAFAATSGTRKMHRANSNIISFSATSSLQFPVDGYASGAEATLALPVRAAGTYSHIQANVNANTLSPSVALLKFRKNAADGNGSITVGAGATGIVEDTTNSDAVVSGDKIMIQARGSNAGAGGSAQTEHVAMAFASAGTDFEMVAGYGATISFIAAGTSYYAITGDARQGNATEASVQFVVPFDCYASQLRIQIYGAATGAGTWTCTLRKNGVSQALQAVIPTAVASPFAEDAVNSVFLQAGDLVNYELVMPGSGSRNLRYIALKLDTASPTLDLEPGPGALELEGHAPLVGTQLQVDAPGALELQGYAPDVAVSLELTPEPGALELQGLQPQLLITGTQASQLAILALSDATSEPEASQLPVLVLGEVVPVVEASQLPTLVLAEIIPELRASELAVLVLCDREPCVAREAQLWRITRRDGRVFRFTSLDVDFPDGEELYETCGSLQPSASESTTAAQPGDIELEGIITSDKITEDDLLAGLFDDAYVEVWLVPWNGRESRRRLAAGWTGNMSRGDTSFRMEVLGPTSRLQQKALLEVVAPSCGHNLGDGTTGDGQCMFDIEAAKRFAEVSVSRNRGQYQAIIAPGADSDGMSAGAPSDDGGLIWENGYIRWINGRNAGQVCEVKSVDFTSGEVVLWSLSGFLAEPGDNFYLYPGCTKDREACKAYGQILNFGGFPDVPGEDAISQTPEAKL